VHSRLRTMPRSSKNRKSHDVFQMGKQYGRLWTKERAGKRPAGESEFEVG
jgi:hypothetical protein